MSFNTPQTLQTQSSINTSDYYSNSLFQISSKISHLSSLSDSLGTTADSLDTRSTITSLDHEITQLLSAAQKSLKSPELNIKKPKLLKLQQDLNSISQRFSLVSKQSSLKLSQIPFPIQNTLSNYHNPDILSPDSYDSPDDESIPLLTHQIHQLDNTITFNSQLIQERDMELINIEKNVQQVNEIFRDLGTLVSEQQYMLDNIESNVASVSVNLENATGELRTARKSQLKSQSKWICFLSIGIIILIILILITQPWNWWSK